jgi:glycosyltransferase involved in cell wall biosynthesis
MNSFIVPAHNEQALIERTLAAIHKTAREVGKPYEVVVVDDASTDATAVIAKRNNSDVVSVQNRQIAATRNAGVQATRGERLFFVDADTTINTGALQSALRVMDNGAVGGGAVVRVTDGVPLYAQLLIAYFGFFMRVVGVCGGAFLFCRRDAFLATGGFDERLFGAEDAAMCWALRREGRFVVLWKTVETSGRRIRTSHGLKMMWTIIGLVFAPWRLKRRAAVEKLWYDSNRENDDRMPGSIAVKISNATGFVVLAIVLSSPVWIIPWPQWLSETPLGWVKFVGGVVGLHVGIFLLPFSYYLARILARQKRWAERIKVGFLLALCAYLAVGNTLELARFYYRLIGMLVG